MAAVRRFENNSSKPSVKVGENKVKGSAYVFPYRKNNGDLEVLVAQKKVICYQAQERLERNQSVWDDLIEPIKALRWHKCLESRFKGLFFYAGGKPTCFGGGINPGESSKRAAAREFIEEVGIINRFHDKHLEDALLAEIETHLTKIYTSERFKGVYYALNLDECELLKKYITTEAIDEENDRIRKDETVSQTESLLSRINLGLADSMSEIHAIRWVELDKLVGYLNQNVYVGELNEYRETELERGVRLFMKILFNANHRDEIFKKCRNFIKSKIAAEVIIDNVDAAKALVQVLTLDSGKTLEEKQHEQQEIKPELTVTDAGPLLFLSKATSAQQQKDEIEDKDNKIKRINS